MSATQIKFLDAKMIAIKYTDLPGELDFLPSN